MLQQVDEEHDVHEATIEGSCDRIVFHNEENGYTVFKIRTQDGATHTCTGSSPSIALKQILRITGQWQESKYGQQLQASIIMPVLPKSKESILKYLASGVIPGIGEGFAKKLVGFAGEALFERLDSDPESFYQIKGVGEKRISTLLKHWQAHRQCHEVMLFLQGFGIGPRRANKIFQTYQHETMSVLKEDPYRIYRDIHGIGFKMADQIAIASGVSETSPDRLLACCSFILEQASQDGHCYLPLEHMPSKLEQQLGITQSSETLNTLLEKNQQFVTDKERLYLKKVFNAEQELIQSIQRVANSSNSWPLAIREYALSDIRCSGHQLSESQQQALKKALSASVSVITGGPGVGKTTITQAILQLAKEAKLTTLLCAPTGRAAKKLASCTQHEAKTIHRLLKMDPNTRQFKHNQESPLAADLILIDECSMIDVFLARSLFSAISTRSNVILVGDIDQLPSVGPGAFLKDMIEANQNQTAYLTEIYRQAENSSIIQNAHRINKGKSLLPNETEALSDFYFISEPDPARVHQTIQALVLERIPKRFSLDSLHDIQILSPMHKGSLGTQQLNELMQNILNPSDKPLYNRFKVGDKVIQTKNNYDKDVFNGDIGFIREIDTTRKEILVDFGEHIAAYLFSETDELQLAYAISIHKSQGSEYPAVIIPLGMQHFTLLERNLIYTAVTRGRKLVIIVGDMKALQMAIRNSKSHKRFTQLAQHLLDSTANMSDDQPQEH